MRQGRAYLPSDLDPDFQFLSGMRQQQEIAQA